MDGNRRKHGASFWSAVVLIVVFVGYPLSFGPACWIASRTGFGVRVLPAIYGPIVKGMTDKQDPEPAEETYSGTSGRGVPLSGPMFGYATLFAPEGWDWWYDVSHVKLSGASPRMERETWTWRYSEYRDSSFARQESRRLRRMREFEAERQHKRVMPLAPNSDAASDSS